MNKEAIIELHDLVIGYDHKVLSKHLSLRIFPGEIVMILGPSGCGKSTLMRTMIGLQAPLSGEVVVADKHVWQLTGAERSKLLTKMGVMFQGGALFGSKSLLDNITLALAEHTKLPLDAQRVLAMQKLALVDLQDFADYMPSELSGGMQKRASVARALALDPTLLFFDEPGASLDPITSRELDEMLVHLAKNLGITFVIVTHELMSVFRMASRILVLDEHGELVADGDPHVLRKECAHPMVKKLLHEG